MSLVINRIPAAEHNVHFKQSRWSGCASHYFPWRETT